MTFPASRSQPSPLPEVFGRLAMIAVAFCGVGGARVTSAEARPAKARVCYVAPREIVATSFLPIDGGQRWKHVVTFRDGTQKTFVFQAPKIRP